MNDSSRRPEAGRLTLGVWLASLACFFFFFSCRRSSYSGGLGSLSGSRLTLYQYEVCPFCCKVKAFLDYHNVPYSCVEVSPFWKKELSFSEYKKVPVLMIEEEEEEEEEKQKQSLQLNDSTAIIAELAARLPKGKPQRRKRGQKEVEDEERVAEWTKWVDELSRGRPRPVFAALDF